MIILSHGFSQIMVAGKRKKSCPMGRPVKPQRTQRCAENDYCFWCIGENTLHSTFCTGELAPHAQPKPHAETQRHREKSQDNVKNLFSFSLSFSFSKWDPMHLPSLTQRNTESPQDY